RQLEPTCERPALTEVHLVPEEPDLRVFRSKPFGDRVCLVLAAVVDEQHLEAADHLAQRRDRAWDGSLDVPHLVVRGKDHRQRNVRKSSGHRVASKHDPPTRRTRSGAGGAKTIRPVLYAVLTSSMNGVVVEDDGQASATKNVWSVSSAPTRTGVRA